jgi:CheY-like chemotaxis protein
MSSNDRRLIEGTVEAEHRLRGIRVLLVEDEPDTRELVTDCLERMGASVVALPAAEEALRAFGAFAPHVILSDLSLPRMDGREMVRRLRSTNGGGRGPAVALSASASLEDAASALDAGFDVHLAKPVSHEDLVAAVSGIVDLRRS